MFGAIIVMVLVPWLDTSRVRSGRFRPHVQMVVLPSGHRLHRADVARVRHALRKSPMPPYALIASAYWFAYFLVILPLLGVIEKPNGGPGHHRRRLRGPLRPEAC